MAILAFQKPDKVIMLEGTETVGRFEFRPLEPGYGQTIGNALRRILLASLEGFAISQIKVGGVQEEFQTIPGVIEGMQDIILNLKQVRFRRMVDTVDTETASITNIFGINNQFASFFGGTSLLITVGVVLDTLQQIESYLLMRHYDGLMKTGRLTGRSGM